MRVGVSTGDEWPGGSAVFQTTFLSLPNSVGRLVEVESPEPLGPRKRDQSSLAYPPMTKIAANKKPPKYTLEYAMRLLLMKSLRKFCVIWPVSLPPQTLPEPVLTGKL